MTENRYKRLVSSIDYYYCIDTNDDKGLTEKDMLNRLNEQDEKIKELEIELRNKTEKWKYELGMKLKYHSKLIDSEKENEQLKQGRNEMFIRERDTKNELRDIKEENEQLKSVNMEMEDCLGRLEESNINLRIKLQKIRDYAKEDGEVKQGIIEKVILND